jgi:hypothetical protein
MSHVTPTIPHPQHLTPHTSFGARSGFQALLAVAEQKLDMIRKGEAVMEEELKSRLFVPDLLSHIPFETRSLKPYPKGFFKTVIQKEYARASQKQIRKDLSDMAMPCYVACIVATCTGDHDNYGIWLGCVLLFASDACCI